VTELRFCFADDADGALLASDDGLEKVEQSVEELGLPAGFLWLKKEVPGALRSAAGGQLVAAKEDLESLVKRRDALLQRRYELSTLDLTVLGGEPMAQVEQALEKAGRKIAAAEAKRAEQKRDMLADSTELLALSKDEIKYLIAMFAAMDADKSGEVAAGELLLFCGVPESR